MRFCTTCGPLGWQEGHNAGCYILQTKPDAPAVTPETFMSIDQVCSTKMHCTDIAHPLDVSHLKKASL